jgi:cytochrome c oxidase subunit IV
MSPCLRRVGASKQMKKPSKFRSATQLSYKEERFRLQILIIFFMSEIASERYQDALKTDYIALHLKLYIRVQRSYKFKLYGNMPWTAVMHLMLCKEISIYVFPEMKLRGLSYIFPTIGPPIFLKQNRQTDRGNI